METKVITYVIRDRNGSPVRYCVGEANGNAKITDALVLRIRNMHEEDGLGYREIRKRLRAEGISISLSSVRRITFYEVRAAIPQLRVPAP